MDLDQDMLDVIASHFNAELFNCALPQAAIKIDRTYPGLLGAFAGRHLSGRDVILFNDQMHAEHAPGFVSVCTTIAHEQVHQWATAQDPKNYYLDSGHTALWFLRMHTIGLRSTWAQSSSGNRTTKDSVIPNGPFMHSVLRLAGHFRVTA